MFYSSKVYISHIKSNLSAIVSFYIMPLYTAALYHPSVPVYLLSSGV